MANLPSLPEAANLYDVFRQYPKGLKPLFEFHDAFLRGDESDWTIQERETMAAFVSGVNQCQFCYGAHKLYAQAFGLEETVLATMVNDLAQADMPDALKATLRYLRKLTETPAKITPEDAQDVLDAGVSEAALYDAIVICGTFNLMNRIVEGTGVVPSAAHLNPTEEEFERRRRHSYLASGLNAGLVTTTE